MQLVQNGQLLGNLPVAIEKGAETKTGMPAAAGASGT